MGSNKLKLNDFKHLPFPNSQAKSLVINILTKCYKHFSKEQKLTIATEVLTNPEAFKEDENWESLVHLLIGKEEEQVFQTFQASIYPATYKVFGSKHIDGNAKRQMDTVMKLPIVKYGALMPDSHPGYGLPIGGVIATENAVVPYAVGVDIGCRMSLTIYDVRSSFLKQYAYEAKLALKNCTHFGNTGSFEKHQEHEILERDEFNQLSLLKQMFGKAKIQLGSSGSGNHFVEFGIVTLNDTNHLNLPQGEYVGILAHSGSRALGAKVAEVYSNIALNTCKLPREIQHLAWLDMDSEAGQEYWMAMNLAGDYAQACHDLIHANLAEALGFKAIAKVENHHNFAWKEMIGSQEFIVHRKGATPAQKGVMGIIPGNMIDPAFIVSGLGNEQSLQSAAHGAGRKMTRSKANESITMSSLKKLVSSKGVTLIGGGPDESPLVYKNIDEVMASQTELVKVEGSFLPKIVRMDQK